MNINNVEHKCENCIYWQCIAKYGGIGFDHCILHEAVYNPNHRCDDFNIIKFKDLIPAPKDKIHRYLDKLKEEDLITSYEIQTMYADDKPYCTDISLYRGKYVYSNAFGDISDQDIVIAILIECLIKIYRQMADDIMDKIKEEKE